MSICNKLISLLLALIIALSVFAALPVTVSAAETDIAEEGDFSFYQIMEDYPDLGEHVRENFHLPDLSCCLISETDDDGIDYCCDECDTMTPQGICTTEDYLLISAYCGIDEYKKDLEKHINESGNEDLLEFEESHSMHNSVIFVYDKTSREFLCTITLSDKIHAGGIAYDGNYVWVCRSNDVVEKNYLEAIKISDIKNIVDSDDIGCVKYAKKLKCNCKASFVTYFEGSLWVGVFDDNNNGSLNELQLSADGTRLNKGREWTIPPKANGADFCRNELTGDLYLVLNLSHGRSNDTDTRVYRVNEGASGDAALGSYTSYTLPPMAEEICIDGSKVYTIFESCSTIYSTVTGNKCPSVIDRVCVGSVKDWFGISNDPDYEYIIEGDDTAKITGYTGSGGDITIPSMIDGYTVTSIGYSAFGYCSSLTNVTIPDSVTWIEGNAFADCTGLTNVTIPDSVTDICGRAFYNCNNLTSVTIPDSVTRIDGDAFWGCTALESIIVAFENTVYDSRNNCNAIIESTTNTLIQGCKNTVIPDSVTSIDGFAFQFCTDLTSITIPDSVMSIGGSAFEGCTGLTNVKISDSVTHIGKYAFSRTAWYNNQPDGIIYAGRVAYKMKGTCPAIVVIRNGTKEIAGRAFSSCDGLTNVTIPDSVTEIGDYAFSSCEDLRNVTIGNSVTHISESAFYPCPRLKIVTIPNSVTRIEDYALGYYYDDGLTKVAGFTIYGEPGTAAETYANENGFTFVALAAPVELHDDNTDISVTLTDDAKLSVSDVTGSEATGRIQIAAGVHIEKAFDIKLLKDGEVTQPSGEVTVKIPCYNANAKVYHVEADGSLTDMNAVYENRYMVFRTLGFSVFILTAPIPVVLGDVDGDGEIMVTDASFIQREVASIPIPFTMYYNIADVDNDGEISVMDATAIQYYLANMKNPYNIGKQVSQ